MGGLARAGRNRGHPVRRAGARRDAAAGRLDDGGPAPPGGGRPPVHRRPAAAERGDRPRPQDQRGVLPPADPGARGPLPAAGRGRRPAGRRVALPQAGRIQPHRRHLHRPLRPGDRRQRRLPADDWPAPLGTDGGTGELAGDDPARTRPARRARSAGTGRRRRLHAL